MTEIQKELDQAFLLLDRIPVQGASVDAMYAVRERLRRAFKLAAEKEMDRDCDCAQSAANVAKEVCVNG